jgi:asparagine synthase (glutamine-hydrolysing)
VCGFVGWVSRDDGGVDPQLLRGMNNALRHRGPDDEGYWLHANVGLGHRRLSIIDTSAAGRQPLANEDGSVVVAFNGEIYNYLELTRQLAQSGHRFRTRTDTEVLVHAYEQWGSDFVTRLDGMFAFALHDQRARRMVLAVDPFGKKPLYYSLGSAGLLFGSELKAVEQHPACERELSLGSLARYLASDYVPSPRTIYRNCAKMRGGHTIEFSTQGCPRQLDQACYWSPGYGPGQPLGEEDAGEELKRLLREAVRKRLMSDVPLGVFLSGGLDSSSLLAVMSEIVPADTIQTFSIGFGEASFDESAYARQVAQHFGTRHHEEMLGPQCVLNAIPQVLGQLDEPFADASILPTYLLCGFARQHITVALGGDGGDELLAGYDPFLAHGVARRLGPLVPAFRAALTAMSSLVRPSDRNMSLDFKLRYLRQGFAPYARREWELQNSLWLAPFVPEAQQELFASPDHALAWPQLFSETLYHRDRSQAREPLDRVIDSFIKLYLHDDILVKVDRASMMHGLEVRVPFLDRDLAAFLLRLPPRLKMRGLERKYLLKRAMSSALPQGIAQRPKKGFGIPLAEWFRGDLRELLTDTLAPARLRRHGIFNQTHVQRLVDEHLQRRRDHRKQLWALLLFELWRERSVASPAVSLPLPTESAAGGSEPRGLPA